jgi:formylglycine-generating enzyme required for sulfatase activity
MEWVEDVGHHSYEGAPSDGGPWVDGSDDDDATRVARGGSLATRDPRYLRATARFLFDPAQPRYVVGVRCARN